MVELMMDTLKIQVLIQKPDPDPEENQSMPSRIRPPSNGELLRLFSSSNWPFFPLLAAWSPAMPGPRRVSRETHLHLELGASPWCLQTGTADQPSTHWTTSVCLFVSHITCIMSPWTWVGCCWGRMVHRGGYSNSSVCMFSSSPHSCYILRIWSVGQRLKIHHKNTDDQLTKNTKKGYAKCWSFFMIVIA